MVFYILISGPCNIMTKSFSQPSELMSRRGAPPPRRARNTSPLPRFSWKKVTKLSVNLMSKMLEEGVVNMYLTWPLLWSEVLSCNFQTFASSLCTIFAIVWTMNIPVLRLILPSFHFSLSNLHLRVALAKGAKVVAVNNPLVASDYSTHS